MTFTEEVGAYRFRLVGPRFGAAREWRYRLSRPDGTSATVLESRQLALEANNVDFGPVEAALKAPLRELSAIADASTPACGAVVNAAVRHMPDDLAFVSTGVGNGFMFLAGTLGNDRKTCVGIDAFADAEGVRDAFRARFDARRSGRHSFFQREHRDYLRGGRVPPIGVFLHDAGRSYEDQIDGLRMAEPFFADGCLIIVSNANDEGPRQAALDFMGDSPLSWRVVLYERTSRERHPTLGNGLMVLRAGKGGPDSPLQLTTDMRPVYPAEPRRDVPSRRPPRVTVLHYRNPRVGVQDYPHLEVIGLDRGDSLAEAFEGSTGDYVVVLDRDVELTPNAISEALRGTEGRAPRRTWGLVSWMARRRNGAGSHGHRPIAQAEYFPSWAPAFDDREEPQTVTVARALSVGRDNLVALDLDLHMDDVDREIAVRFGRGLRLEGPAARCSRVPGGVVAGRVGAVLTPQGGWLIESVGAVTRAWPELVLDDRGTVAVTEPPRESDERVATVVCERRREWFTENFGHWTFEVLTRVAMLLRAGVPDDVKLLVPEPVLRFQRETLVGLGIADDRILPWDGVPTRFRAVYVPTARPTPPFLFPAGVELLRKLGAKGRKTAPGRRLFVSRRQLDRTTRIANEEELLEVAGEFGFVEVMPERLAYSEQLRLYSEAEIVAGAHGSGLANAIFMSHGTGMCELAPAGLHAEKLPNFWDLAACGRQRYAVCIGDGKRVDPKRFKARLRDLIDSTKRERTEREGLRERKRARSRARDALAASGDGRPGRDTLEHLVTREELPELLNRRGLVGWGAEVGVKKGGYSETFLRSWHGELLISVDPWREADAGEYRDRANVPQEKQERFYRQTRERLARFGSRSEIWRLTSLQAAARLPRHSLDCVFIDARHDRESVLADLEAWFDKVRPGGIIAGHDYVDGDFERGRFGVKSAVEDFFGARVIPVYQTGPDPVYPSWFVDVPSSGEPAFAKARRHGLAGRVSSG
jgi:hypothetical protein